MARGGWDFKPTEFMVQVESDLVDHQKEMVIYALTRVQMGSPVDSGAFRSNHRVSIGAPDFGFDPSEASPSAPAGSLDQSAFNREAEKLQGLNVPYTQVYVQNNLPYSTALEYGHSEQAPQGVYGIAANDLREKYGR